MFALLILVATWLSSVAGASRLQLAQHVAPLVRCSTQGFAPYLHTCGPYIEDAHGRTVRLLAVNWYGFESNDFVAAGLDRRSVRDIINTVKRLGFNALRLPVSNEMVERNPVASGLRRTCPRGASATACLAIDGRVLLAANRDLYGLRSLQILKTIVDYAGARGLYVILDDHRSRAGRGPQENGLWYDDGHGFTQANWLSDWQRLVRLFAHDPALTGVDLFNEPHALGVPSTCSSYLMRGASWGTCHKHSNPKTDWRAAAEQGGNASLAINPHLLIVVEGVSVVRMGTGVFIAAAGENLVAAGAQPVRFHVPHQLVYSAHDYYATKRVADMSQEQLRARWTSLFGYLTSPTFWNVTPVWIGEFGTCNIHDPGRGCVVATSQEVSPTTECSVLIPDPKHHGRFVSVAGRSCKKRRIRIHVHTYGYWFEAFMHYLNTPPYRGAPPFGWAYWPLNGTTPDLYDFLRQGWISRRGEPETFGLLDLSWQHVSQPTILRQLFPNQP